MRKPKSPSKPKKGGLHPRNRHQGRYDFERLIDAAPGLAKFVAPNEYGDLSIDFADPRAVKALNQALLKKDYGIAAWDIPPGYLCPPIPGRADYVHCAADLLGDCHDAGVPQGEEVRVLDVGVGANCIYPLVGNAEYGWRFVGSEIDPKALESAKKIVESNPGLNEPIELRLQRQPQHIFEGVIQAGEEFDLTICNPPFHSSPEEAREGTRRKWKNLGRDAIHALRRGAQEETALNFGGQSTELWCPGGELEFIRRMIWESREFATRVLWFTTLVSKSAHLPKVIEAIRRSGAEDARVMEMSQGQKVSRVVTWTFLDPEARHRWRKRRWQGGESG